MFLKFIFHFLLKLKSELIFSLIVLLQAPHVGIDLGLVLCGFGHPIKQPSYLM